MMILDGDEIPNDDVNETGKLTIFKKTSYPPPGPKRDRRREYMKIYMQQRRKKLKRRGKNEVSNGG